MSDNKKKQLEKRENTNSIFLETPEKETIKFFFVLAASPVGLMLEKEGVYFEPQDNLALHQRES